MPEKKFQSNPNTILTLYNIQEKINTKTYEENKYTKYKPITSSSKILEEAKGVKA